MHWAAVVALSLGCGTARGEAPSIRLATAPERTGVVLLLGAPPSALVQETRAIALPEGQSTLTLSWSSTKLVADSLRLTIADAAVQVSGPRLPAEQPQQAEWTLTAPQATETEAIFRYLMGGLTWAPEYTLVLDDSGAGSLSAVAAVRNDSGEDFEGAQIDLGLPQRATADLEQGMVLRLPYTSAETAACELADVFEAGVSPDTSVRLTLRNTPEAGLGSAPLPAGKLRLYGDLGGARVLTGEVLLPATPIGAKAELTLGTAREVSVERRVLRVADVDVKKDVHGRIALYNREEEVAFLVESQKDQDVLLKIVETIDGEWKVLSNSHEFERKDASHVEFLVPVPAHSKVTAKYKVRRINLLP